MSLTPGQKEQLEQLWAVTDSTTPAARERDERLLRENGWNVQATVEQIFSMGSTASPSSPSTSALAPSSTLAAQTEYPPQSASASGSASTSLRRPNGSAASYRRDRSASGSGSASSRQAGVGLRAGAGAGAGMGDRGLTVLDLIFGPFRLAFGLVSGVWYFIVRTLMPVSFLRYLPPFLRPPSITAHSRSRARQLSQNPTVTSQTWVSDLEILTGLSSPSSTTPASGAASGTLPTFYIGPYREFLDSVKKEGKVGMIVLTCVEHEDDGDFKRGVLGDGELVRFLREKEIMVWGADVKSREGYQVAGTLLATTYPSLYFVSLLPGQAAPAPKISIITSLSGSPTTATSSGSIIQVLTTSVLPRTAAFLARLKRERSTLEEARHLREEQDRAFRAAEERDRERARAQRESEQAERDRLAAQVAQEQRKASELQNRAVWRRYARKHLLPPPSGTMRVSLRTPLDASRNIRHFTPSGSTESLFVYAETLLIPSSEEPADDPDAPPPGYTPPKGDFRLVTSYPRNEVRRVEHGGEDQWEIVRKAGGALFAEKTEGSGWGVAERKSGEDSDEEEVVDE